MLRAAEPAGLLPRRSAAAAPLACDRLLGLIDRYRWWAFAFVAACYAAAFNGQWRIQPDAALYLGIGRNLAAGHGYTFLGQPNRLAYPGWPVMIAAVYKVFGPAHAIAAIHVLLTGIALATVGLTYRLVRLHAGRPTAVAVSVGTAVTKSYFVYALELWSDLPFACAAMAVLAGYEGAVSLGRRRWTDWALLVGGLAAALVIRPTGWPLLAAVTLAVGWDAARGRVRWTTLLGGAAVVVAAAAVCLAVAPGVIFGGTYARYLLNRLAGGSGPLDHPLLDRVQSLFVSAASDVLFQVRFGTVANSILSGIVIALGFGLFRRRAVWGLWFTLLLVTVLLVVQETLDRYFLPVLPLLVYGWWSALVWVERTLARRHRPLAEGVFLVLLGFGALANITKVFGLIDQQHVRPFLAGYDHGRYLPVPALSAAIERRVGPGDVVMVKPPYGRVVAFLSGRMVINATEAPLMPLAGRRVFVVEPTDPSLRAWLDRRGLAVGPAVYAGPVPPASSAKAEPLSLHTTVAK